MLELDEDDYEVLGYSKEFDLRELKSKNLPQNFRVLQSVEAYNAYMKEYMREWRRLNPKKVKEIAARQRAKPEYKARQRNARKKRKEKYNAYMKDYMKVKREKERGTKTTNNTKTNTKPPKR